MHVTLVAQAQVELVLKSIEDEISMMINEYVISMQNFDAVSDLQYDVFL